MLRPRELLLTLVLASGLAGLGALLPAAPAVAQSAATPAVRTTTPMDAEAVVSETLPAVVTVINEQTMPQGAPTLPGMSPGAAEPTGIGTGFIIDEQGHIVTNEHVVHGGDTFVVILQNGEKRTAKLVGADPISDLAVVKIDGAVPAVLHFGNSDQLHVGQSVLAIGSALGDFTGTVTEGIIGALGRDIPLQPGMAAYSNLIQHDAAINPGNSGGPLVDASGDVIGVNTLGISADPQVGPVQGLFFAIPSNAVQRIVQTLIATGNVAYPYIGAQVLELTPDVASQYNLSVDYGAYIARVEQGGPAQMAGIQKGDVITAIDGKKIDSQDSFTELLFAHKPGDQVDVTLQRAGKEQHVTVTLGQRPIGA
ncbi:MAG TPA: trypsin-like peptidase domain-containing protein [Thermomicrobiales bacterium]|nr:trypsin-like peptidase domain-containing protein [Thermomicrobiales bacterium]